MFSKISFIAIAAVVFSTTLSADIVVKSNDKIAFLGDSITQHGNYYEGGYINLVIAGLHANGIKAIKVPAGISGNKAPQMLARLEKDVISKKPQFMTLSCGVNDVWHGARGVPLDQYKKLITELVEKASSAGIKVCIMTASMILEKPENGYNTKLAPYNDFLRKLAKEKGLMLADVSKVMHDGIAGFKKLNPGFKGNYYTYDGVHMNSIGNEMMAETVLRTFGLNDQQIAKAKKSWQGKLSPIGSIYLPADVIRRIAPQAAAAKMTIQEYITRVLKDTAK